MLATGHDWKETKLRIEACLERGEFRPFDRLPSEPALCARFQVRRHSLRRALDALSAEGRITRHQGKGIFVAPPARLSYAISLRTRYSENLQQQGVASQGEILDQSDQCRSAFHAARLGLPEDAPLIWISRRSVVDGRPFSLSQSYVSAARFPDWLRRAGTVSGTSRLLQSYGIDDYLRRETTILARLAEPAEGQALGLRSAAILFETRKLDVAKDGTALISGETLWPADLVQFTLTDRRTVE